MSTVAHAFDERATTYDESALHRDLAAAVARFAHATKARVVLDVATGTGLVLRALAERGRPAQLTGIDVSTGMLQAARARLPNAALIQARAEQLPVRDAAVDLVTCVTALHLVSEPNHVFNEFARVLAPGGRAVLATFQTAPDNSLRDRPYRTNHAAFATPDLIARAAAPAGFTLTRTASGQYGGETCLLTELAGTDG